MEGGREWALREPVGVGRGESRRGEATQREVRDGLELEQRLSWALRGPQRGRTAGVRAGGCKTEGPEPQDRNGGVLTRLTLLGVCASVTGDPEDAGQLSAFKDSQGPQNRGRAACQRSAERTGRGSDGQTLSTRVWGREAGPGRAYSRRGACARVQAGTRWPTA